MTINDLIAALQALPPEQRALPLAHMVWRDGDDYAVLVEEARFPIEPAYDPRTESAIDCLTIHFVEPSFPIKRWSTR